MSPELLKDVARLFSKLHSSNSETEILSAVRLINKKLEAAGSHISLLAEVLEHGGAGLTPEQMAEAFAAALARADMKDVDILLDIARKESVPFCTPDDTAYADVEIAGHRHTIVLRGESYKSWLIQRFFELQKAAPADTALKAAIRTLQAQATYGSSERHEVFLRVAKADDGAIYIDIGDREWHAIKITAAGWEVVDKPSIRFRRPRKPLPLPMPERGGSVKLLRDLCNLSDLDFVLFVVGIVDALIPDHPHPPYFFDGEPGAAKTSLQRIRRDLIDPIRGEPKPIPLTGRHLFVDLENAY